MLDLEYEVIHGFESRQHLSTSERIFPDDISGLAQGLATEFGCLPDRALVGFTRRIFLGDVRISVGKCR